MKRKNGFTLIELLATIVVLGIVLAITGVLVSNSFHNAKKKSQDVFIGTLEDAMEMYLNYDAKTISSWSVLDKCVNKTHKLGVKVYKANSNITFNDIINGTYSPLSASEIVNPADKDLPCSLEAEVEIFKDEDYVYYYRVDKNDFGCLIDVNGYLSNLPTLVNCE